MYLLIRNKNKKFIPRKEMTENFWKKWQEISRNLNCFVFANCSTAANANFWSRGSMLSNRFPLQPIIMVLRQLLRQIIYWPSVTVSFINLWIYMNNINCYPRCHAILNRSNKKRVACTKKKNEQDWINETEAMNRSKSSQKNF